MAAAERWHEDFIEQTPAQGIAGVPAKLRYQAEAGYESVLIDRLRAAILFVDAPAQIVVSGYTF